MPGHYPFRSALVTGASSGIGAALAGALAVPGMRLVLGGRDAKRLDAVAEQCRRAGAEAETTALDLGDADKVAGWVRGADARHALDLAIACAGISGETGHPGDHPDLSRRIMRVNVEGVINTIEPLLPAMRSRRRGQIGIVASVAGMRGISRGPVYSGSKAALIVLGQGWREALAPYDVGVTVLCPGYVRTPLADVQRFRKPFMLDPEDAARRMLDALTNNRARVTFPWPIAVAGWLFRALPGRLTRWLLPGPDIATDEAFRESQT